MVRPHLNPSKEMAPSRKRRRSEAVVSAMVSALTSAATVIQGNPDQELGEEITAALLKEVKGTFTSEGIQVTATDDGRYVKVTFPVLLHRRLEYRTLESIQALFPHFIVEVDRPPSVPWTRVLVSASVEGKDDDGYRRSRDPPPIRVPHPVTPHDTKTAILSLLPVVVNRDGSTSITTVSEPGVRGGPGLYEWLIPTPPSTPVRASRLELVKKFPNVTSVDFDEGGPEEGGLRIRVTANFQG